jgi:hypothetical protein
MRASLRFLTVLALTAVMSAGCKSQCRQLSEKLCDCAINSVDKDTCIRTASASEGTNPPNADDEALCASKLETCNCRLVDTPNGKFACGLSRAGDIESQ